MSRAHRPGIDHIDLSVSDLDRSVAFYDAVLTELGFQRSADNGTVDWRGGAMEIGIRAAETPDASAPYDRYRVGLHHLAFRAESRAAVDRFHDFLKRHDFEILDAPAAYPQYGEGYYAVFFADPDGMKLELVYRPRT